MLGKIPQPYRTVVVVAAAVLLLALLVLGYNSCRSGYVDKQSEKHDERTEERSERERELEAEVTRLRAEADQLSEQMASRDAQIAAFKKLAEDRTGLDKKEAQKIDEISKAYEREAAVTDADTDAATRWNRLCAKYAERGIKLDCSRQPTP